MIDIIRGNLKRLSGAKFRFDLPKPKKILQLDELNSNILKKVLKKDFNVMPLRNLEIYFWIFVRQLIFLDFRFSTYFKNYIKFTSTKIVITLIDNNLSYYKFKDTLKEVYFLSIQNGVRNQETYFFKRKFQNANPRLLKNLKCDHFFVFNNYYVKEYKKIIKSGYHIIGSFNNNINKLNKTKYKNSYLFIALGSHKKNSNLNSMRIGLSHKLLKLIASYFLNSNLKLNILLKNKDYKGQDREIEFYKRFFKKNCIFHRSNSIEKSYKIVDKFDNIIFTNSTLGYEAISRKKKVAIFPVNKDKIDKKVFGWPKKNLDHYNFFLAKKLTYSEIKRVLDNVYNCKQNNWEKKYYRNIKDLMYFDRNNTQIRNIISRILNATRSN